MKSKVFYLLVVLLLAVAGCADNSGSSNGGTQSAGDGTLGGQTTAKIKEYFTAGSGSTAAVNAKVLYRDNNYRNDFEQDDDIEGVRLFFRYEDNTTSEAVYNEAVSLNFCAALRRTVLLKGVKKIQWTLVTPFNYSY